ncbi:MAG TPA: ABC transporter ATP-binding protein [Bacillota bacterium]
METICELKNIDKRYRVKEVLHHFSLSIPKGELIAITGRSGSGKTTLLNIIGLLEKPDSGSIRLFGKENPFKNRRIVNELLRTKIAYLFQNFALIDNESIRKNLTVPLIYSKQSKREKEATKESALRQVGLDLSLDQKIYELSGGEQQRVAIARLLLKPSELILADEPTGSVDADHRDDILALLKELHQRGKTILIVTHDPYVANICQRVICLDEVNMVDNVS